MSRANEDSSRAKMIGARAKKGKERGGGGCPTPSMLLFLFCASIFARPESLLARAHSTSFARERLLRRLGARLDNVFLSLEKVQSPDCFFSSVPGVVNGETTMKFAY